MKLLRRIACHSAMRRGNEKRLTVMGEVLMDGFSDRGSIPLISIKNKPFETAYFFVGESGEGIALSQEILLRKWTCP